MTHKNISRWQHGVSLIEALVAIVILSVGILSIAKLGSIVLNANGEAKIRAQAVALAEAKIEEFRDLMVKKQFLDIASSGPETVSGYSASNVQSAVFTRWWTIGSGTDGKSVQVFVSWVDRGGVTQQIAVRSYLAWDDPAHGATYASSNVTAAGAYAKSPTGRARLGSGTASDAGITNVPTSGVGERVGSDGKSRLVASDGTVLLTATNSGESFSKISGNVYVDQQNLSSLSKSDVYIVISDASYCEMTPASSLTNLGSGSIFKYFSYKCYLGAGWYGNIGVIRTDNANTNDRVCVGDPNVVPVAYSTDSDSRHPALSTNREYRGYNGINSTGIGIGSAGVYTAAEYDGHDFLLTRITGNPQDTACKAKLQRYSSATPKNIPFGTDATTATPATATTVSPLGNPGKFFCLSSFCPSPLPSGVAPNITITITGAFTGGTPTSISIDTVACTITGSAYSCVISLPGFTGGTWSSEMEVVTSGDVCPGVSGTASPLPSGPSTGTPGGYIFLFENQATNAVAPTLNFRLAAVGGC